MSEREQIIDAFLTTVGWGGAACSLLAADASFRRYLRVTRHGQARVLMDAPPPKENVEAFHRIASALIDLGLSAPRPLEIDSAAGLLLLEDFGDRTFSRALSEGVEEDLLYRLATDALIALHRRWRARPTRLAPPYDEERLLDEALLLTDWFLPALRGAPTPGKLRRSYIEAWRAVLPHALGVPECLVLRDFHVDNLMLLEGRQDVAACGLLDFQDAVIGPRSYDLVSLLEDARRDIPAALVTEMLQRYMDAFPDLDREAFRTSYDVLGAQRAAKIIGIFTRLSRRDGKHQYLQHIPRVWRILEADLSRPALAPVKRWFDQQIVPHERIAPPVKKGVQA